MRHRPPTDESETPQVGKNETWQATEAANALGLATMKSLRVPAQSSSLKLQVASGPTTNGMSQSQINEPTRSNALGQTRDNARISIQVTRNK